MYIGSSVGSGSAERKPWPGGLDGAGDGRQPRHRPGRGLAAGRLPAALQAAGLTQQVKIGGETPSAANLQALRNGTQAVWAGFATSILGWRVVDMLARQFVGDSLAPANSALLPTQLLTPGNIGQAKFDSGGIYVGVTDYQAQFKSLWHI